MKGGENIRKQDILISLILICLFVLSLNLAFAQNQTDDLCGINKVNDSMIVNDMIGDSISGKTIEINQDSYDDYFNRYTGEIKNDADIKPGDVLRIANVTDRGFVIDRQLTIMPNSSSDQISNGFIHLIKGSDGSIVTGLTINNTDAVLSINSKQVGYLHGIWLSDTSNNTISYNVIRIANSGGVYALPMHSSSRNNIVYNDMKTYVSSNIIMSNSHYNFISRNKIQVLSYSDMSVTNLIYFSPFAFAGRLDTALCEGCTISYNELIGYCTLPMSIIIQAVYANHENTIIANNTIIKGSYGINVMGSNAQVYGNDVNGSAVGIAVNGANISVCDNVIYGSSQKIGLAVYGSEGTTGSVTRNDISYDDVEEALHVGSNLDVYDNIIDVENYGNAIGIEGNYSTVHNNKVKSSKDDAITIHGNNDTVDNNIIITNARGVSITTSGINRYYNNTISNNKITSDSYGIYLKGLVYYTTISSNVIETNASVGIYKDITDAIADNDSDNMVNGVIYDATALVINDDNFYEFFDEDGYLNYTFKADASKTIFFNFVSNKNIFFNEKINVVSNKQSNLLFNVTITFEDDASGSLIRDFNFVNYNKNAIVLDGVDDVSVVNNNITAILNKKTDCDSAIFVCGVGDDNIISNNNIYVNSKVDYAYGISISSYNPRSYTYNREFSKNYRINDNTIIMISSYMGEGIFSDSIVESEVIGNKINIISHDCGYGIAAVNVIGRLYGWNISDNEIIVHADKMAYLVELHMSNSMNIENNYLFSQGGGSYGIASYRSNNISIINNVLDIFGNNIKMDYIQDVIGAGCSAILISEYSNNVSVINNTIYSNATNPIDMAYNESIINLKTNTHVISQLNYGVYFNPMLNSAFVRPDDTLLLNLSDNQELIIDIPVNISSHVYNLENAVVLIFNEGSNNSNVSDIKFINSAIHLNDVSNLAILNNDFNDSIIIIHEGYGNYLANNSFNDSIVKLDSTLSDSLSDNIFNVYTKSDALVVDNSQNISISSNEFTGIGDKLIFIRSSNSNNSIVKDNSIFGDASEVFGYYGSNSHYNSIIANNIKIKGNSLITNQSGVYLSDKSSNNYISDNRILSNSLNADDYAVEIISDENLSNKVVENYLISGNGSKRSNYAVNAKYDLVADNTPYNIFVSVNGSDIDGDGSQSNPFASIGHALRNALNNAIIYVGKGVYFESDLVVDKNITIIGLEDNVIIDADLKQLFGIAKSGILTINNVLIRNGHNVDGGSLFINNGSLIINNSVLCNSSSYYDNSNPIFDNEVDENHAYTIDCRDTGKGGAILNQGNLIIDNSFIYGNIAHIGGAIADFGKTKINSSVLYANQGVHGGTIYTDSSKDLIVNNTIFYDNKAITTFDYCMVRRAVSTWSVTGVTYSYSSMCSLPVGEGGAIYSNNTNIIIDNSVFNKNSAHKGGAIATKYVGASNNAKSDVDLIITNSSFIRNLADDTKVGNSDFMNNYEYNSHHDGGAVYGAFNKFNAINSNFIDNQAGNDGGALYVQSGNALIDYCNIVGNRAGSTGGGLFISNNFLITRTVISNNSARYGGALSYDSYYYYGHVQNNLNIYNSTISDNMALISGGAMRVGQANITVHQSNIYDNFAPESSTISPAYITTDSSRVVADMRYNYWGPTQLNGRPANADDSVYNFPNMRIGSRLSEVVSWIVPKEDGDKDKPANPTNPDDDGGNTPGLINPTETNSRSSTNADIGRGTGSSVGYNGTVVGPNGSPYGPGSNLGDGDGGKYDGPGLPNPNPSGNMIDDVIARVIGIPNHSSNPNANTGNPEFIYQEIPSYSPSKDNPVNPNANPGNSGGNANAQNGTAQGNSVSRVNSSQFDESLDTFGLVSNAVSAASSSSSGYGESSEGESSSSSSSSESSRAYEIENKSVEKEIGDYKTIYLSALIAIIIIFLLIFGYRRKNDDEY